LGDRRKLFLTANIKLIGAAGNEKLDWELCKCGGCGETPEKHEVKRTNSDSVKTIWLLNCSDLGHKIKLTNINCGNAEIIPPE
jgi:hypothetical protein